MEHLADLGPEDCLIFVSNHRSFFDFYVIGPILYTRTRLAKTILFPVRSPFFYDSVVGGVVNGIMSGFFMFPPIMRGKEKRGFNAYALDRMVASSSAQGCSWVFTPRAHETRTWTPHLPPSLTRRGHHPRSVCSHARRPRIHHRLVQWLWRGVSTAASSAPTFPSTWCSAPRFP